MRNLLIVIMMFAATNAVSATKKWVDGKVTQVQFVPLSYVNNSTYNVTDGYGWGMIWIDNLPDACNTTASNRVAITSDHPLFQSVISAALTAKASNATVRMYYLEECTIKDNAWNFGQMFIK